MTPPTDLNKQREENKNCMTKIKSVYEFIKNYPKLTTFILLLGLIAWRMFTQNYEFQQPVISKRAESYYSVWNERAALLQQVEELRTIQHRNNLAATPEELK